MPFSLGEDMEDSVSMRKQLLLEVREGVISKPGLEPKDPLM